MWDAVSGAAGGLLDGFRAVPKASNTLPTLPGAGSAAPSKSVSGVTATPNVTSRLAIVLPAKVVDAIDKFNTGFKGYVSSYDELRNYVGDDLANKLLANPVDDVSKVQ